MRLLDDDSFAGGDFLDEDDFVLDEPVALCAAGFPYKKLLEELELLLCFENLDELVLLTDGIGELVENDVNADAVFGEVPT
jgi:hypothetical protein